MPTLEFACDIEAPLDKVWIFYDDIGCLFKLTPPEVKARLEGEPVPMGVGVVYHLLITRFGVTLHWDAEIIAYEPPRLFRDRQVDGKGPFQAWTHTHTFDPLPGDRTRITDHVHYHLPFGPLGRLADFLFVRRELGKMFAYRHKVTRETLERQQ